MTSTISSVKNKNSFLGMMKWSLKKSLPVTVIYSFLLFVLYPMYIIMYRNSVGENKFDYLESLTVIGEFSSFLICIITIITAIFMFSIYHNKRSVDLYASLPVKRHTLFLSRYFSGLLIIIVPLVIFTSLGFLLSFQISSGNAFVTFYRLLANIISIINMYSMLAFFAMLCGGVVDTLVSFGVVNIGVVSCISLVYNLICNLVPGYYDHIIYNFDNFIYMLAFIFSPFMMPFLSSYFADMTYTSEGGKLIYVFDTEGFPNEIKTLVIWFALAVIYFVVAVIIAKKRKNENVQNGFIYSFPKVVIQVIASVAAGVILGNFFTETFGYESTGFTVMLLFMAGALIGSLGAFLIVTLIYNRGLKKFTKSIPAFVGSFVAIAVFYLAISTGLVGASNVPDVDDIQAVALYRDTDGYYTFTDDIDTVISKGNSFEKVDIFIEDENIINNAVNLHQSIVDGLHDEMGTFFNMSSFDWYYADGSDNEPYAIRIDYKLKNGKIISKMYTSGHYNYDNIQDTYNEIVSSDIYKQNAKLVKCTTADEANINSMNIYSYERYTSELPESSELDEYYDEGIYTEYIEDTYTMTQEEEYNDVDLYDSEFTNQVYNSLREEYIADKNVTETLKAYNTEYVEPTSDNAEIYDEVAYFINLEYRTDLGEYAIKKKCAEIGVDYDNSNIDPMESFVVTKDAYPQTWELLNNKFEQDNIDQLYLYPNNRTN